jgi:voltage-gated potassium channel
MELRRRILTALLSLLVVIALALFGYRILGGPEVGFLQALYMAIITLAGVGYGEFVDTGHSSALRIFNIFIVLFGVMITAYVFSSVTAFLVEGDYSDLFRRRKMHKKIKELKDHFVVCGLGDTGRHAVAELHKTQTPYVVIDQHEDNMRRLIEHAPATYQDMLYVTGDATEEEVLEEAGIDRARGLLTTLPHDKDNLVITVMVRQRNPAVRIVSRCTDPKFSERVQKAGANAVISPNMIGGLRLASEALRPHVVSFLDLMLREQSRTLRIEEIDVPDPSAWTGRTLGELALRHRFNLLPMAVKNAQDNPYGQNFWVNPPDSVRIQPGVVVIALGDVSDIRKAREDASRSSRFSA